MKIEKLKIDDKKFNINLKLYFILKHLVKASPTDNQALRLLEILYLNSKTTAENIVSAVQQYADSIKRAQTKNELTKILQTIEDKTDIKLLSFSVRLLLIKDLLLQEAKIKGVADKDKLRHLPPLSLEYDKISVYAPYSTRVNGALLSLLFFSKLEAGNINFMSQDSCDSMTALADEAKGLISLGIEPNQIFMLLFSESINQSITSDSGSNYEDRILATLVNIGLDRNKITKTHDKNDASTEFDFFFVLDGKTYGIGAKRTLRERYKQFIKTGQMSDIDVMIEITLGLDLNKDKAETIRKHGVYLFVADEIYTARDFLQKTQGVYPVSKLTLTTLKSLGK